MKDFLNLFYLSFADSFASKALYFGMVGNVFLASYFEQLGKIYQDLAQKASPHP